MVNPDKMIGTINTGKGTIEFVRRVPAMSRSSIRGDTAIAGSAVFLVVAPGVLAGGDSLVALPVAPTRQMVITGLYRYIRNPMYLAVLTTVAGQGVLFGNKRLLAYGAIVWLLFHLWVVVYEEPALRTTFGSEYRLYCARVPRWIPRLKSVANTR